MHFLAHFTFAAALDPTYEGVARDPTYEARAS